MDYEVVFDERTFYPSLFGDLKRARALVIIQSPFISLQRLEKMQTDLRRCAERGVRVCAFVREPDDYLVTTNPRVKAFNATVEFLESLGVHVALRPHIHEKYVIVDEEILYAGSLNILSQYKSSEEMRRWEDFSRVRQVIKTKGLDTCDRCRQAGINMFHQEGDLQQQIAQAVRARRVKIGMTQADLAWLIGMDQRSISQIECGNRNVTAATLGKLCKVLDINLMFAPWYVAPSAQEHILNCNPPPSNIQQSE